MSFVVLERSLERRVAERTTCLPLQLELIEAARAIEYLQFRGSGLTLEAFERRLAAGARCLVARLDGRIVAAGWSVRGAPPIAAIGRLFSTGTDDAWTYDWLTASEHQGRALATVRLCHELRALASTGARRVFAVAPAENRSVFGPLDRTGFRPIASVRGFALEHGSVVSAARHRRPASLAPAHMRPPPLHSRLWHAMGAGARLACRPTPQVLSRTLWGATPARRPYVERGQLRAIVVHHTGIQAADIKGVRGEAAYVRAIQRRHFTRGWNDLGYHFIVTPSGRVCLGRPVEALGAHVLGYNRGTVGLAVAGDFECERPSPATLHALREVIVHLRLGKKVAVVGHWELADTPCPGRFLHPYLDTLSSRPERPFSDDGGVPSHPAALR